MIIPPLEEDPLNLQDAEMQLKNLHADVRYMASLDALSGFDLLRTEPNSTKYFGITTLFGNYKLLGAPMGYKNTPVIYQQRMINYVLGWSKDGMFALPNAGALLWLDDIFVYSNTFEDFLDVLNKIFINLIKYGVRLNASKCEFIARKAVWCGRDFTSRMAFS